MLSQKAKYALKALLALAGSAEDELLQANDIAEMQNIPKKFLDLILLELRRHKLVDSRRGKKGGYLLGRPAKSITIGEVVRIVDGPLAPIPCASVTAYRPCADCDDVRSCAVRRMMRRVRDAASEILDNTTLAEAAGAKTATKTRATRARRPARQLA
jgi:Rrf2 family protein